MLYYKIIQAIIHSLIIQVLSPIIYFIFEIFHFNIPWYLLFLFFVVYFEITNELFKF